MANESATTARWWANGYLWQILSSWVLAAGLGAGVALQVTLTGAAGLAAGVAIGSGAMALWWTLNQRYRIVWGLPGIATRKEDGPGWKGLVTFRCLHCWTWKWHAGPLCAACEREFLEMMADYVATHSEEPAIDDEDDKHTDARPRLH
jgi:hypothetical protein